MTGKLTAEDIFAVYRGILGREPENEAIVEQWVNSGTSLEGLINGSIDSYEFFKRHRSQPIHGAVPKYARNNGTSYSAPDDLEVSPTGLSRVLVNGSCLTDGWVGALQRNGVTVPIDRLLVSQEHLVTPPTLEHGYDFQITQLPLRWVYPDWLFFEAVEVAFRDPDRVQAIFEECVGRLERLFDATSQWTDRFPNFVCSFITPQRNFHGRLLPRYDLRNPQYFIEQLNERLAGMIEAKPNCYLLDLDSIASTFGKRFFAEDAVWQLQHGGMLSNAGHEYDQARIVATPPLTDHYDLRTADFVVQIWREAEAMYRTVVGRDAVKMVCVDLDDTLWRGVLAEAEDIDIDPAKEGWPMGLQEALAFLKARGVILAIISKNDEANVKRIWDKLFFWGLKLEDFAIRKINWTDKATNIQEAMSEANLLPRNVVFLDDNPAERARVKEAFPDLRVIDAPHHYWKRILLWSAETQVPAISAESARRTELIKAQVVREEARSKLSREDFLTGLGIAVTLHRLTGADDKRFPRSLELLNKTNQFNTTGERWTQADFTDAANRGGVVVAEVKDKHSDYGLVFVCISRDDTIVQVVMSCRVIGLGVEATALSQIAGHMLARNKKISARMIETDANLPSRDIFSRSGWTKKRGKWEATAAGPAPEHVKVEWA